jgi:hypothetical protein
LVVTAWKTSASMYRCVRDHDPIYPGDLVRFTDSSQPLCVDCAGGLTNEAAPLSTSAYSSSPRSSSTTKDRRTTAMRDTQIPVSRAAAQVSGNLRAINIDKDACTATVLGFVHRALSQDLVEASPHTDR